MAEVIDASHATLTPMGTICGARVFGGDGAAIGSITELMIEAGTGRIAYAAMTHGGVLGLGEKLFAVPWDCFAVDPLDGALHLKLTAADLSDRPGFDKDAWPTAADESLRQLCRGHG